MAHKHVGAELQNIVFNEFLNLVLVSLINKKVEVKIMLEIILLLTTDDIVILNIVGWEY